MRASSHALKTACAILAVLVSGVPAARAADDAAKPSPGFRAAMKRFLVAQNIPAQMGEQMSYSAAEQALAGLASSGVTITEPMQAIVVEQARKDFGPRFSDVDFLTDLYSKIYADHFTEAEVAQLASFWESPVAKKLLEKTPTMDQAFTAKFQEATAPVNAAFQGRLEKRLRDAGFLSDGP